MPSQSLYRGLNCAESGFCWLHYIYSKVETPFTSSKLKRLVWSRHSYPWLSYGLHSVNPCRDRAKLFSSKVFADEDSHGETTVQVRFYPCVPPHLQGCCVFEPLIMLHRLKQKEPATVTYALVIVLTIYIMYCNPSLHKTNQSGATCNRKKHWQNYHISHSFLSI